MITRDQIVALAPKPKPGAKAEIWQSYCDALVEHGADLCAEFGIDQPCEIQHFMAQVAHESGGFTVLWEDMSYSSKRIMEIFGVGRHSAKVTHEEAKTLSHNPEALAERVYGIGNPRKAKELGNKAAGDGYKYRGFGPMQITGRADHERLLGGIHTPAAALRAAYREWDEKGCNEFAAADDIKRITRKINGGYNGIEDRKRYLAKAKRIWVTVDPKPVTPAEIKQVSGKAQVADAAQKLAIGAGTVGAVVEAADPIANIATQLTGVTALGTAVTTLSTFVKAHAGLALILGAILVWFFGRHIIWKIIADLHSGRYFPAKEAK